MNSHSIDILWRYAPQLIDGFLATIELSCYAISFAFVLGSLCGIALSRHLRVPFLAPILSTYIFVVRGVPFFVQLLMAYFVIPDLFGIDISPFCAAALALILCLAGYIAEIVRAGINSIPRGQWEACYVLGYTKRQALRFVIVPQMLANVWPALSNEITSGVLTSSVVSHIGVLELTKVGSNIIAREMNPMLIYSAIAGLYLLLTTTLIFASRMIERRLRYDHGE
ncbi:amino acid ABC transporter permease [Candidatus Babeliales bacterium]|nr:amino acid ABC transporter permease [Candidatus Babeliales bacterium]